MDQVYNRKIQRQSGEYGLPFVYFKSEWFERHGIYSGDVVRVEERGNKLVITPEKYVKNENGIAAPDLIGVETGAGIATTPTAEESAANVI